MNRHDLVLAVRELLERNLDLYEIASRLHVNVELIRQIMDVAT
jgi:hypothetical protein